MGDSPEKYKIHNRAATVKIRKDKNFFSKIKYQDCCGGRISQRKRIRTYVVIRKRKFETNIPKPMRPLIDSIHESTKPILKEFEIVQKKMVNQNRRGMGSDLFLTKLGNLRIVTIHKIVERIRFESINNIPKLYLVHLSGFQICLKILDQYPIISKYGFL